MALQGGASAGAIRAGQAFIELFAKDDKLTKSLAGWKAAIFNFAKGAAKMGAAVASPGLGVLGIVGATLRSVLERGDAIAKGSTRIGATAEEYSALAYAAEQSGTSIGAVEKASNKLAIAINSNDKAFKELGINLKTFRNLSKSEQFAVIAEKLQAIEDPSKRTALAMKLLGKGAAELKPLFANGAEGIRELVKRAERVGAVVSEEDAKNAEKFGDALDDLGKAGKYAFYAIGAALLPLADDVEYLTDIFVDAARGVKKLIDENRRGVQIFVAVAAAIVFVGTAIVALGAAAAAVGFAMGAIATPVVFILSPLGLFIAAVVGVVYVLHQFTDAGTETGKVLRQVFGSLLHNATQAVQGIVDAITAGDLEIAVKIAGAAMNVAWKQTLLLFEQAWAGFKAVFVDGFYDALYLIENGLIQLAGKFKSVFGEALRPIAQFIKDNQRILSFLGMGALASIKISDSLLNPESTEKQLAKLADKYKQMQDERDKARGDDIAAAQAALDAAQSELEILVAMAALKRKEREAERKKRGPDIDSAKKAFGASFGLFDAPNFKAAFARADSDGKRTADAAEGTEENTKGILDAFKNLQPLAFE